MNASTRLFGRGMTEEVAKHWPLSRGFFWFRFCFLLERTDIVLTSRTFIYLKHEQRKDFPFLLPAVKYLSLFRPRSKLLSLTFPSDQLG